MYPVNSNFTIIPPESKPFGLSYVEWTKKWWQWIMCIPRPNNPLMDTEGKNCSQMQFGPIWFLAGTTEENPKVVRNCISAKNTVIIPIFNTLTEYVSNLTDDDMRPKYMHVSIDGTIIQIFDEFRIKTEDFMIDSVTDNVFKLQSGLSKRKSDGYWLILSFAEGNHHIEVVVDKNDFKSDVSYNLTIKEPSANKEIIDKILLEFDKNLDEFVVTKRAEFQNDIREVVKESIKYSQIEEGITDYNIVTKNIYETLNYALSLAKQHDRNIITSNDMTNAIFDLGIFRKWHTWPFCKSAYPTEGDKNG
jgi:hypothetical protein